MDIGVFIPIGNNGWLISTTSQQYMPSFALNREIVQKAERYGLDFALSMIKLRGFGGVSEFWDHNLESFTLMAGLAAVTERIRLYASVAASLTIPPAIVARMAATIDSIAPGRFGVNLVSGWAKAEYEQMGLWPGEAHFARRYDYSTQATCGCMPRSSTGDRAVRLSRAISFKWTTARLSPRHADAGQDRLRRPELVARYAVRVAEYGDYNFVIGSGVNTPTAHAPTNERMLAAAARTGRDVGTYVLLMVIADATDAAALGYKLWRAVQ